VFEKGSPRGNRLDYGNCLSRLRHLETNAFVYKKEDGLSARCHFSPSVHWPPPSTICSAGKQLSALLSPACGERSPPLRPR